MLRVVAEPTADLVGFSPDNLSVVASVIGKPRVRLSIIMLGNIKISHEGVDVGVAEARRDDFVVPAQRGIVGNFVHQLNISSERERMPMKNACICPTWVQRLGTNCNQHRARADRDYEDY